MNGVQIHGYAFEKTPKTITIDVMFTHWPRFFNPLIISHASLFHSFFLSFFLSFCVCVCVCVDDCNISGRAAYTLQPCRSHRKDDKNSPASR